MDKLTRKQREDKRKKFDIIQAALTAFAAKGFHGATMAEISTESEFPLATIYKLFGSKEQIYFELLKKKGEELTSYIELSISDKTVSPKIRLKKGLDTHYRFCKKNRDFTKIYLEERQRLGTILPEDLKNRTGKLLDKLFNLFAGVLQEGIDKGHFEPYSNRDTAEIFVSIISSAASNWLIYNESDQRLEKRLNTGFEIFIRGICKTEI